MLDTKTLTKETIKECRNTSYWLKCFVKKHAPEGTVFSCDELRVNDAEGDEYIFCEVTLTCNKRTHHFNFYAGTNGCSLVERLGGKKGEDAFGDKMGKVFEMEFNQPSADDRGDLEEFLEKLADYAPKKHKAEKKQKKIFVVSGFHFHPYEQEHDIITEVFNTRKKAAKCIFDILTETFPNDADEFTIDGCMWGNSFCNAADEEVTLDIEEFTV